jgi:hypothetical protein
VRNAQIVHRRWGWRPVEGWLSAFHERGLISRAADGRPEVAWWGRFSTWAPDYWPALARLSAGLTFVTAGKWCP